MVITSSLGLGNLRLGGLGLGIYLDPIEHNKTFLFGILYYDFLIQVRKKVGYWVVQVGSDVAAWRRREGTAQLGASMTNTLRIVSNRSKNNKSLIGIPSYRANC